MSFFVRKIEYNKWMQNKILIGEQPSADAITNCMRTIRNKLSLWSIKDKNEIEDAILAIASEFEHLDSIDILTIESSVFIKKGLKTANTDGPTAYKHFSERHFDVIELNYSSLGSMANVVIESIQKNQKQRITRGNLKKILTKGILQGKIEWHDLNPGVQKHIPKSQ